MADGPQPADLREAASDVIAWLDTWTDRPALAALYRNRLAEALAADVARVLPSPPVGPVSGGLTAEEAQAMVEWIDLRRPRPPSDAQPAVTFLRRLASRVATATGPDPVDRGDEWRDEDYTVASGENPE